MIGAGFLIGYRSLRRIRRLSWQTINPCMIPMKIMEIMNILSRKSGLRIRSKACSCCGVRFPPNFSMASCIDVCMS